MKYKKIIKYLIDNYEVRKEYTFDEIKELFNLDEMHKFYDEIKNYINPNYIIEVNFMKYKIIISKHIKLSMDNKIIDIRGYIWECRITFENGYLLKCSGELESNNFIIYTNLLKISNEERTILKELIKERNNNINDNFIIIK